MTNVFIISAPSGSGKSTLVSHLMADLPGLMFSISYTTASPRLGKGRRELPLRIPTGIRSHGGARRLSGMAEVFGNYYGTHRGILEEAGPAAGTWYSTSTCKVRDN